MARRREVLGIPVSDALLADWVAWLAPERQPFLVAPNDPLRGGRPVSRELRDTFELYGGRARHLAWLTEADFVALSRDRRKALVRSQVEHGRSVVPTVRRWGAVAGQGARRQADGHRFVWWRSLLEPVAEQVLSAFVDNGRRPSRHDQVAAATWRAAQPLLPRAKELAGRFPTQSGPNCFAAVMEAAGAQVTEDEWESREPFDAWLAERTDRGGDDSRPGTVLVWRTPEGAAEHAAVTLGDGWALHKPSQGWMSPTKVLRVEEVMLSSRARGRRLSRRRLIVG